MLKKPKLLLFLLATTMVVGGLGFQQTSFAASATAKWKNASTLVYKGVEYSKEISTAANTDHAGVYFTTTQDYSKHPNCPPHRLAFASGVDVSEAKNVTYQEFSPSFCASPLKEVENVTITNNRPGKGGPDTGGEPLLTNLGKDDDNDSPFAADPAVNGCTDECDQIFTKYLIPFINFLSAAVGIIVIAVIIFSGIQFSASSGNPEATASAKKHIQSALIALIAFLFLWAFLNFIMPGGLINGTPVKP